MVRSAAPFCCSAHPYWKGTQRSSPPAGSPESIMSLFNHTVACWTEWVTASQGYIPASSPSLAQGHRYTFYYLQDPRKLGTHSMDADSHIPNLEIPVLTNRKAYKTTSIHTKAIQKTELYYVLFYATISYTLILNLHAHNQCPPSN